MITGNGFIDGFLWGAIWLSAWFFGRFLVYISDCIQKKRKKDLRLTCFDNLLQEKPIYEQVLLFASTLLPNEKIIVSREDYQKILSRKDERGYYLVSIHNCKFYVSQFELKCETVNNFPRAEFGEKKLTAILNY
jgi:hypothetical protein